MKNITITDKSYTEWISQLSQRYKKSQIRAAVKVNSEMLKFYWELGKDIVERQAENQYGKSFYANLSRDLQKMILGVSGLTENNVRYTKRLYELYSQVNANFQQVAEDFITSFQKEFVQLPVGQIEGDTNSIVQQKLLKEYCEYIKENS
ncbi:MAG: DUF1016 N-terminal domain-containing protein [Paludibacteraceae bacterium]|nr:DUF1016 N-terminal domain-containing protein [Paludibacteraceae bacterium]